MPNQGYLSSSMVDAVEPILIRYGAADGVAQMTPVTTIIPQRAGASISSTNSATAGAAAAAGGSSSGSKGLSTGAKAGIAIGAVLGVALLIGLAFIFFRARRSHRDDIQETYQQSQSQHNLRDNGSGSASGSGSEYKGGIGAAHYNNPNYSNPNYTDPNLTNPNYSFQTLDSMNHGKHGGSEVQSHHYASTVEL
jgi:hypothetical protein